MLVSVEFVVCQLMKASEPDTFCHNSSDATSNAPVKYIDVLTMYSPPSSIPTLFPHPDEK